ncbi:hypothetical protein AA103581_0111 [Gluconobacter wancherniae NBRC 103581]|nr:hypothetical protein AA103581_0111 [Gluconobacter wancherniae NBRC 103581]
MQALAQVFRIQQTETIYPQNLGIGSSLADRIMLSAPYQDRTTAPEGMDSHCIGFRSS